MFGPGGSNNIFNVQNSLSKTTTQNSASDSDNGHENSLRMENTDLLNIRGHESTVNGKNTRRERELDHEHQLESTREQTESMIPSSKRRTKSRSKPRNKSRLSIGANEIRDGAPSSNKDESIVPSPPSGALPEPPRTSRQNTDRVHEAGNDTTETDVEIKNIMDELNKYEQRIEEILNGFQESVKQATEFTLQAIWSDISKSSEPIREEIPRLKRIRDGIRDAKLILRSED